MEPGTLYLVATPIGNLADITLRALEVLRSVDRIAAEDTRHSRKLLAHYDIHRPLMSHHAQNVEASGADILRRLSSGESIALITDAGTPGISDPGALLVHRVLEAGLPVVSIPGPTALVTALTASGLPTHPFVFLGFPPARGNGRSRFFKDAVNFPMTLVLYESARRLHRTLSDILEYWGERRICVAREITKRFEEYYRGNISGALEHFAEVPQGEVTLVVGGAEKGAPGDTDENAWRTALRELLARPGGSVKDAVAEITGEYGLPRKLVYAEALRMMKSAGNQDS